MCNMSIPSSQYQPPPAHGEFGHNHETDHMVPAELMVSSQDCSDDKSGHHEDNKSGTAENPKDESSKMDSRPVSGHGHDLVKRSEMDSSHESGHGHGLVKRSKEGSGHESGHDHGLVKRSEMGSSHESGHVDYSKTLFGALDTIEKNLDFDVLAKFNELYDRLEGSKISGGPGSSGRENRDKYNEGIKVIMADLFAKIDKEVSKYGSYDKLPPDLKETLDAVATWIQTGLHAGKNNDMGTMAHALEGSSKGQAGAAFVLAHGVQAGDDTKMGDLFRNGRQINQNALDELDGAKLFDLMEKNDGLTGLYAGGDGKISTFWGASADVSAYATQNPAGAIDYFKKN